MTQSKQFGPVEFINGKNNGRYPYCNSIYIPDAGVIIDPSSDRNRLEEIVPEAASVWLSHWHEDHIKYLYLFRDKPLWMHKADEPPLLSIDTFVDWYDIDENENREIADWWRQLLVEQFNFEPRGADRYLEDGEVIDLGSVTVDVIHAPGHSPGNLAFFFREPQVLFLGDNDLTNFGPWYGDRYSDIDQIIESVKRLREVPAKVWLTGHLDGVFETDPGEVWDDYLDVVQQREDKLYELLKHPKTLEEIVQAWIVYKKPREPIAEFELMEKISMKKHADRLIRQGLIQYENGVYSRV